MSKTDKNCFTWDDFEKLWASQWSETARQGFIRSLVCYWIDPAIGVDSALAETFSFLRRQVERRDPEDPLRRHAMETIGKVSKRHKSVSILHDFTTPELALQTINDLRRIWSVAQSNFVTPSYRNVEAEIIQFARVMLSDLCSWNRQPNCDIVYAYDLAKKYLEVLRNLLWLLLDADQSEAILAIATEHMFLPIAEYVKAICVSSDFETSTSDLIADPGARSLALRNSHAHFEHTQRKWWRAIELLNRLCLLSDAWQLPATNR